MHEHLDMFSLINMNGRLYDPVLCRMLSPDPFIQSPDNTQNYNRYSYCWNNPLKYTDPSGEIIEGLIVGSAGFIVGYTAHGITTGDWGKGALISGGIGAATALVGFYTCGAGLSVNSALTYSGKFAANAVLNNIIPSSNVQIGNVNLSIGIGVGFGANGLSATATSGISVNTKNGSIGVGFGGNNNMLAWKASARIGDYGVNYGKSYYGGEVGPDGIANKQTVGQVGINAGKFSFRIENDFMGDGHDRWRSNAAAVGWGNWELGTNLRNNLQNDGDPVDDFGEDKMGNINKDFKGNRYGKWKNGETYSSPLWLGYKNGNNISRIGYSNPIFQDRTQNWVHKNGFFYAPFGHANFFSNYNQFSSGGYAYSGYNNPYSLW
jgi:RHS repeat-associated protein